MKTYRQFLESKITVQKREGFRVDAEELHDGNFPHQDASIRWALSMGRALIAMSFGLGKTRIQCEIGRMVHERTGKKVLVICPLGVRHQFVDEDGPMLGMEWHYCKTDDEIALRQAQGGAYIITNYERVRDGNITPSKHDFAMVSLDEGAILRSLGSKTYQVFIDALKDIPFRYVATATPAPNEYKEIIHYAEFLGIMDRGQALTRWFKRDPQKAGHLTIHPIHEEAFWKWVSSWALFLLTPGDLGYPDDEYKLPELRTHWHRMQVDQTRAFGQVDNRGQRRLLLDGAAGVREAAEEKRATLGERLEKMLELIAPLSAAPLSPSTATSPRLEEHQTGGENSEQWVIWCHLNVEQDAVEAALKERGITFSSIYGSLDIDEAERRLYEWKRKETRVLIGKPVMLGSGLNLQQCHKVIFLGIDYKFADFIQAVHRVFRFQQKHPVDVHLIYAESEDQVVAVLKRKWQQHDRLVERMRGIVRKYNLSEAAIMSDLKRSIGVTRDEYAGTFFTAVNHDCILEMENIPDDYAGLIHTSIPFGNHYEYTAQAEDFGYNPTDQDFWVQMDYLIPELLRVLKPGRVAAIHVKDRILYGHQTKSGFMEVAPFSDECVMAFRKHGFLYEGRRTIVTDVVRENASTYRLGWTEMSKDASKMGSGLPEYLLLFRKPPSEANDQRADEPVTKEKTQYTRARWQVDAHSFWRSNGNRPLMPDELYDYEAHVGRMEALDRKGNLPSSWMHDAPVSPSEAVWTDVVYMRTLNMEQARKKMENHICPLPFDIVSRTITLYSNERDVVLDPFAGLFTVPYLAMKLGRYGHGIELNSEYYEAGLKYCQAMEREKKMPTLFDYIEAAVMVEGNREGAKERSE